MTTIDASSAASSAASSTASSAASSAIVDAAVIYTRGAPEINRVFVPRRDRLSQPCVANALGTQ